ncbi:hypothetical protein NL676_026576 [Syzygium grande]|nr:hypothetical protein NL676_026576 [Syzygium grande]
MEKGSRESRARSGQAPLPTGRIKNTRNQEEPIVLKAHGIPRIRAEAPEKRAAPKRPPHATAPNENSNPPEEDEEEEDGEAGGERGGALLSAPSSRSAGGARERERGRDGRPAEGAAGRGGSGGGYGGGGGPVGRVVVSPSILARRAELRRMSVFLRGWTFMGRGRTLQ